MICTRCHSTDGSHYPGCGEPAPPSAESVEPEALENLPGLRSAIAKGIFKFTAGLDPYDDEAWLVDAAMKGIRQAIVTSESEPAKTPKGAENHAIDEGARNAHRSGFQAAVDVFGGRGWSKDDTETAEAHAWKSLLADQDCGPQWHERDESRAEPTEERGK